ncbi:MAG TPA: hypothetical protein PLR20_09765 [Syntrophales bacterium]|nr:hypothetical protein [Syntrophales bacterium]HOX93164.1 hypothetical protein [Syntrophales bacterium]HPI57657.1 hypothetical protein [Syntrophales bacterium]HPN25330.1 hypothetical protein [Syntrophales bacterium]HQM29622.1 hypothetical protein [Syntrophales bacterium]
MKVFIGFDDTDTINAEAGTGKLARRFEALLPEGCRLWGVLRQQLLVDDRIPYTSHNSSACAVVLAREPSAADTLLERAIAHIEKESLPGSDPGLCLAHENGLSLARLMNFGVRCTKSIASQKEALAATRGFHLSGHGGTNDGVIGAAAAVGLTASGWSGRFIEFGRLRDLPDSVPVEELERCGMQVIPMDRDDVTPGTGDRVDTNGWLRPRLLGHRAVVVVVPAGPGLWRTPWGKRRKGGRSDKGKNDPGLK